jgi:hypothetical protein
LQEVEEQATDIQVVLILVQHPEDPVVVVVMQDQQIKVAQEVHQVFPDKDTVVVMVQEHLLAALHTQVVAVVEQEPKV